ncbi:MAG: hypothetical protein HZB29_08910 [Nitrospinae bacterium]|nr:hypothetical protein [Nitrospinota bacterium]
MKSAIKILLAALLAAVAVAASASLLSPPADGISYYADPVMEGVDFWKGRKYVSVTGKEPYVPIQLPGPADTWGGGEQKEIRIYPPFRRGATVVINLFDSHNTAPPMLEIIAGGETAASIMVQKGAGLLNSQWENQGMRSSFTASIPAHQMEKTGEPVIIRSKSGSWIAIDSVKIVPRIKPWEFWRRIPDAWAKWMLGASLAALAAWGGLAGAARSHAWRTSAGFRNAVFGMMMMFIMLAVAEGAAALFFHYTKKRFTFYDFSEFLITPEIAGRLAKAYDKELGWHNLYQTPHGERPRPVIYDSDFMATFGDSFTHCDQVENDETWETYLSTHLKKNVYNFGVGGYGTDQAYLYFKRKWPEVKTKVAALCIVPENICRVANVYRKFYYPQTGGPMTKPRFILEGDKLKLIPNPVQSAPEIRKLSDPAFLEKIGKYDYWYNQNDYPTFGFPYLKIFLNKRFWMEARYLLDKKQVDDMLARPAYLADIWESKEADVLMAIIDAFVADARAMGTEPVIAVLPIKGEAEFYVETGKNLHTVRRIIEHCRKKNYRVFDGVAGMARNAKTKKDVEAYFIGHTSPLGNRLLGDAFYEYMQKEGLVEDLPTTEARRHGGDN